MSEDIANQKNEKVKETAVWTNDDVVDLMSELESALGMMEPYYSQNDAGKSGYDLLRSLRAKQDLIGPYFHNVLHATSCKVCQKSFGLSVKKKQMSEHQQHSMAMQHIREVHGVEDYKERRGLVVKPYYEMVEFENRKAYLESFSA